MNIKNKKTKANKKRNDWVFITIIFTFFISCVMSFISEMVIPNVNIIFCLLLIVFFIFLGIIFDIIGVAITTADKKVFHSMSSKKINGSKKAISLIEKKDKVSNFCNDVIGDICGVISGSCGLSFAIKMFPNNLLISTILITGIISALTIGGKALGKGFAVQKSNDIVFYFAKLISSFSKNK